MRSGEIFLIAIALGMDAFSVAICKGLTMTKMNWKNALKIASFFGIFQAGMLLLGFCLGKNLENWMVQIDHWIAFFLLGGMGANLLKEGFSDDTEEENNQFDWKTLTILGIATSMDAFAIGITFSFMQVSLLFSATIIGTVAFAMSFVRCKNWV